MNSTKELTYQWTKGDLAGTVEIFDNNDGNWITFKSGRRINVELFNEYLFDTSSGSVDNFMGVTGVNFVQDDNNYSSQKSNTVPTNESVQVNSNIPNTSNVAPQNQPIVKPQLTPVQILLTQATKESTKIDITISIDVPKKSVYSLIKDAFDNTNIDEEILNTIYIEINNNEFKENIKKQIEEKLKIHYKK